MNNLMQKPYFWPIVAILLLGILTKGSAFVIVLQVGRYLLVAYLVYWALSKILKKTLSKKISNFQDNIMNAIKQQQEAASQGQSPFSRNQPAKHENVIDLCPKCGQLKTSKCPQRCGP